MAKPSFNWTEAAAQLTRNLPSDYLPAGSSGLTLTYAYRATETAPQKPAGVGQWIGGLNLNMTGFFQFNASQIAVMERALDLIEDAANIKLTRVGSGTTGTAAYSDSAQLLFGNYTDYAITDAHGSGNYVFSVDGNGNYVRAGKAWFKGTEPRMQDATFTNAATYLFLHETMHTLGLSHPGDYSVRDETDPTYDINAVFAEDSRQYTVMSYFGAENTGGNWGNERPLSPMIYDIAALQKIYGANMTTRTGDTVYGFNSNTGIENFTFNGAQSRRVFSIWDAGGNDTLDMSGLNSAATLNLNEEAFSSAGVRSDGGPMINNIGIARGAVIENAIGGRANDTLIGNKYGNSLKGGGGNDAINGGNGLDTAVFAGNRADYTVTKQANGSYSVVDNVANRDGTDSLVSIERLQFADQTITDLPALFANDLSQSKAIAAAYQVLLGGVPSASGLWFLMDGNIRTNFGAGQGAVFNDENIFINVVNALVQGNPSASAKFGQLATGATIEAKLSSLYAKIVPLVQQSAEGLTFLTRAEGIKFYRDVAVERGITAENGPAVIALASLLKIAVDAKFGIGNAVSDLLLSVADGTSELPPTSEALLPIETIDGTRFDADDAADAAATTPVPPLALGYSMPTEWAMSW